MPVNPQIALLLTIAIPVALVIALFVATGAEKPPTLWQLAIAPAVAIATTGALLTQTSSYAFTLFAGLFGIRFVGAATRGYEGTSLALFDAALSFALAMIVAQRIGIFRRARALLRTA